MMGILAPETVAGETFEGLVAWPSNVEGPLLLFVIDEGMVPYVARASQRGVWVIAREPLLRLDGMNPERFSAVPDPLRAFRNFAKSFRATLPCPVVAVGGSNGKTTTKDLKIGRAHV